MKIKWIPIFMFFVPLIIGFIPSIFTRKNNEEWYPTLKKPVFNPQTVLFPIVWTILFLIMGVSGYRTWYITDGRYHRAKLLFFVQLFFNFWWTVIFFGFKSPIIAMVDIIVLWITIILWIQSLYILEKWIAFIQVPYLCWVTFASVLNGSIIYLN
uniref:Tryptophan-rich sensory protein n=1 Tax=Panagrolaimus sp. ES5 TaxID=591445 RepID=A0AC34G565_9BILA